MSNITKEMLVQTREALWSKIEPNQEVKIAEIIRCREAISKLETRIANMMKNYNMAYGRDEARMEWYDWAIINIDLARDKGVNLDPLLALIQVEHECPHPEHDFSAELDALLGLSEQVRQLS